jgi:hypothetical protein
VRTEDLVQNRDGDVQEKNNGQDIDRKENTRLSAGYCGSHRPNSAEIPSAPPTMSSRRIRPPAKIPKSRITESTKLHRDDRERVTRDEGQHIAIKNEQHRVSMPYFERQKAMYSCCRVFHNSSRLPELVVGIMGALENREDARAVESGGDGLVGLAAQFLDHFAA